MIYIYCVIVDDVRGKMFISYLDFLIYSFLELGYFDGIYYILYGQNINVVVINY